MFPMIGMMRMTRMLIQMAKITQTMMSSKKFAQVDATKHCTMRFDPCTVPKDSIRQNKHGRAL